MAKLTRVFQKIFGNSAPVGKIGKYGSFAAGSPATTTDPVVIQSLVQFDEGWTSAILGNDNPAIEDANALDFLIFRQLAYLFQAGVPEWDTDTIYFIGSIAQDGLGNEYVSLTDNNTGNALSNPAFWSIKESMPSGTKVPFYNATAPAGWTLDASVNDRFIRISSSAGGSTSGSFSNLSHTHNGPSHTHSQGTLKALIGMNTGASTIGVTRAGSGTLGTDTWATGGIGQNNVNNTTNYDTAVTGTTDPSGTAATSTPTGLTHDSSAHAYADFIICTKN